MANWIWGLRLTVTGHPGKMPFHPLPHIVERQIGLTFLDPRPSSLGSSGINHVALKGERSEINCCYFRQKR